MLEKMSKSVGTAEINMEVMKRTGIRNMSVSEMNEVTCKKVLKILEDILIDVVAGDVQPMKRK